MTSNKKNGNGENKTTGNKTWHNNKLKEKEIRATPSEESGPCIAYEILLCGEFLSLISRVLYPVMRCFNPCHPSLNTLSLKSGLGKTAVAKALNELEAKKLIRRHSGQAHRTFNLYTFPRKDEWNLLELPLEPVKGKRTGKFKKPVVRHANHPGSPNEPGAGSPRELELDQIQLDQKLIDGAPRYAPTNPIESGVHASELRPGRGERCPNGQDQREQPKGVPSGDNIAKKSRETVLAQIDEIETRRRSQNPVGSVTSASSAPNARI